MILRSHTPTAPVFNSSSAQCTHPSPCLQLCPMLTCCSSLTCYLFIWGRVMHPYPKLASLLQTLHFKMRLWSVMQMMKSSPSQDNAGKVIWQSVQFETSQSPAVPTSQVYDPHYQSTVYRRFRLLLTLAYRQLPRPSPVVSSNCYT